MKNHAEERERKKTWKWKDVEVLNLYKDLKLITEFDSLGTRPKYYRIKNRLWAFILSKFNYLQTQNSLKSHSMHCFLPHEQMYK